MATVLITQESDDDLMILIKALVCRLSMYEMNAIHVTIAEFREAEKATIEVVANMGGTLDLKVI